MGIELKYKREGDYLIPDVKIPEQPDEELRYYGQKRLKYLEQNHNAALIRMNLAMTTNSHLIDVQTRAEALEEKLIKEMKEKEGITEDMKNTDQLGWVGAMNNIKARAREIVLNEVVFVPL